MFIQDLWKKQPNLVVNEIKKICKIDGREGEQLYFEGQTKQGFKFGVYSGRHLYSVYISDFAIEWNECKDEGLRNHSYYNHYIVEWMKFMCKIYGDRYVQAFESYRNTLRDLYIQKYEQQFDKQTEMIVSCLEKDKSNNVQNQVR